MKLTTAASDLKDELMQQQREKREIKNFYSGLILETQKSLNTNIHTDSQSQGHSSSSNVKDIAHTSIRVPIPDYYNDNKSTTRHPTPSPPKKEIDCGCPHVCDKQALNKRTAKLVCKKRIEFLMEKYNDTEKKACAAASETTPFADIHLPCEMECHPEYCKDMTEKPKIEISRLEIPNPMYERYEGRIIDYEFSRRWDDQLAVTVPAVIEDSSKTWDHRAHGVHLGLHHNTMIDGKERGDLVRSKFII
eukprot:scaffold10167_cov275-Chaetoceros_neogracile.AAC.6